MNDEPTPAPEGTTGTDDVSTSPAEAPVASIGLATDGAYYLIVGQFPTAEAAEAVYGSIEEIERTTSLRVDAVVIASADAGGNIHVHEATDHSTKTGLKWGVVGGVVLGVVFPPSILASAVGFGVVGSVLGKVRNLSHRSKLSEELAGTIEPGTTGLIVRGLRGRRDREGTGDGRPHRLPGSGQAARARDRSRGGSGQGSRQRGLSASRRDIAAGRQPRPAAHASATLGVYRLSG